MRAASTLDELKIIVDVPATWRSLVTVPSWGGGVTVGRFLRRAGFATVETPHGSAIAVRRRATSR